MMVILSLGFLSLHAGFKEKQEVATAIGIIKNPNMKIPKKILKNAKAIAIIPNLKYGGLIFGATYGHGILTVKGENGWSDPSFITFRSINFGLRAGVSSNDVVLVFENARALDGITDGKVTISLSAGAVIVKNGSAKGIKTDGKLSARIYLFSKSSGLELNYASLSGGNLYIDDDSNDKYYDSVVNTDNLIEGVRRSRDKQVLKFLNTIATFTN